MAPLIGYYAHTHGTGHLTRAGLIANRYPGPVHILGTGHDPRISVPLPPDSDPVEPEATVDATANGVLHWAPQHSPLLPTRAAALVEWVRSHRPALVVVDVSVEVALLIRLLGVPVVVVRQHGDRTDSAHQMAFRLADALLSPYPEWAEDPTANHWMRAKTLYCGGFSRFDDQPPPTQPRRADEVVVMAGTGGTRLDAKTVAKLAASGSHRWVVIGLDGPESANCQMLGRIDNPWPLLSRAGVVVTSAGHSALCEVAAARAPAIAVAESRPFAEQEHKVAVLAAAGMVHQAPPLDHPAAWHSALRSAVATPTPWERFVDGKGLDRAVDHLVGLASSLASTSADVRGPITIGMGC